MFKVAARVEATATPAFNVRERTYGARVDTRVQLSGQYRYAQKNLKAQADKEVQRLVEDVRDYLIARITTQQFTYRPLTAPYLRFKTKHYGAQPTLVASGEYLKAIKVMKGPDGWIVGIEPFAQTPDGTPYIKVAATLEFGSNARNIPPRPHWRLAVEYGISRSALVGQQAIKGTFKK